MRSSSISKQKRLMFWAHALTAILLVIGSFPSLPSLSAQAKEGDYLLSLNRPVYASSALGGNTPDLAVDGNLNSRWESVWQKDPQWIYVDLGASADISKVVVNWENAYSSAYTLQISDDETHWNDISDVIKGKPGEVATDVSATGRYVRLNSTARAQQAYGISIYEFSIYGTGGVGGPPKAPAPNLALNKPVTASSLEINEPSRSAEDKAKMEERNYLAANVTDGDPNTRWSSIYTDKEWIYVDLGQESEIGSVVLNWEAAYGRAYDIQVSDDASHWTTIYRQLNGSGGKETIPVYANTRYIKMAGIGRGSSNGYSLFELEVHAYRDGDPKPSYDIPAIPSPSAVQVGAGSYEINDITQLEPKNPQYRTSDIDSPIPSNDWWQSILISNLGDGNGLVTLPLKNWYTKQGLAVLNPGAGYVSASGDNIDADGDPDLYLSTNNINPASMVTKISGYGDYSASVLLSDDDTAKMNTTFVKGSPFIYNTYQNPDAVIIQSPVMTRLFDDNNNPVLVNDGDVLTADHIGLEVVNKDKAPTPQTFTRDYGIFAPPGTVFMKLGNTIKIKLGNGDNYLSLAALPSASKLGEFYQHAYAFVTDTKVDYNFDQEASLVTTNFNSVTELKRPGFSSDTIMTLLPHQWKISNTPLTDLSYPSIRGTLKVNESNSFTTQDRFNGIIPQFVEPNDPTYSRAQLIAYLDQLDADLAGGLMVLDPYWQGKKLHPLALAVLISDQLGDTERRDKYLADLRTILTDWYTYSPDEPLHSYYFHYSQTWGSVFPYSSGYGVNTGLTDHHFTYGYYIFASAVLATYDKDFLNNYGGMVETLIRDYANPSKTDSQFPWFRNFDPYEGHSWAGGYADNHSGNNQEAAGEALFSWVGEYMWGLVSGNNTYRDAGIWGFTTEEKSIEQYWFNYDGDNWPAGYNHATVGQVYGSAYLYGTYFSGDPEDIYGIHWLPPAEWMTYYGRQPEKTANLYQGLINDLGGQPERSWFHIIWPFESISDPDAVLSKWDTTNMQQNEAFNAYWFVHSMETLGHRSPNIWADDPAVTVYEKDGTYTAQIWNPSESAKTIHFFNQAGALGSATVYANALVSVDPTKDTVLDGPDPTKGVQYLDRSGWKITASSSSEAESRMIDGDLSTRWSSGRTQADGDWVQIDLGSDQSFDTLFMNSGNNWGDYAHGYDVYVSEDGQNWGDPITSGTGTSPSIAVSLQGQTARFVKIVLTDPSDSWWSISELKLAKFGDFESTPPVKGPAPSLDDRSGWKITASSGNETTGNLIDEDLSTEWSTGQAQTAGDWLQVDLGADQTFDTVQMDSGTDSEDYAHNYAIYVSEDDENWGEAVASGAGTSPDLSVSIPEQTARFVKIMLVTPSNSLWSIADLKLVKSGKTVDPVDDPPADPPVDIPVDIPPERNGSLDDPSTWIVTASSTQGRDVTTNMQDGNTNTLWTNGKDQANGQWLKIDLGTELSFDTINLNPGNSANDYPRGYKLFVSHDGINWGSPVAAGSGEPGTMAINFPVQTARFIRIVQTGTADKWWSVAELGIHNYGNGKQIQLQQNGWTVQAFATSSGESTTAMLDGDADSRWTSGKEQRNGDWFVLDLGQDQFFDQIVMDSGHSRDDYAHGYEVYVSNDGESWGAPVASGVGLGTQVTAAFPPQTARYIKVVQTSEDSHWWSISDLKLFTQDTDTTVVDDGLPVVLDSTGWTATASTSADGVLADFMLDGDNGTRWTTGTGQAADQWIQVDLGHVQAFRQIRMDSAGSANDYAHGYQIFVSLDGQNWDLVKEGQGQSSNIVESFPEQAARFVKIVQTENTPAWWWSVAELNLFN